MTDAVDDAIEQEEYWADLKRAHNAGHCDPKDCPFCDPDFEPLFEFQKNKEA